MKLLACFIFIIISCNCVTGAQGTGSPGRDPRQKTVRFPKPIPVTADPFKMPGNVSVTARDNSGKTWQVNGKSNRSMAETQKAFMLVIGQANFKFQYEIPLGKDKKRKLLAWRKQHQELILMLWYISDQQTGFAWGMGKR